MIINSAYPSLEMMPAHAWKLGHSNADVEFI